MGEEILNKERNLFLRLTELRGKVLNLVNVWNILLDIPIEKFGDNPMRVSKQNGDNPGEFLNEYVLLEITNFYTLIHLEKNPELPSAPEYWDKLKEFRNIGPGHADKKKEFKTYTDLRQQYKLIDEIGLIQIVEDFMKTYDFCAKVLKK